MRRIFENAQSAHTGAIELAILRDLSFYDRKIYSDKE